MISDQNTNRLKTLGKASSTFYFKQFKVEDGRSTMKVGTDAVMLGSVAGLENAEDILEIGTGSGVITLILAQRSDAMIDAIEIDEDSVIQARENVRNCPWNNRIRIIHTSLQDFVEKSDKKYGLVICNPPYFSRSLKSPNAKRNISRHDESLSFGEFIRASEKLMLPGASLWVILPVNESREFIDLARKSGLYVHYLLKIASKTGREYRRVIPQLMKTKPDKAEELILIMKNEDDSYTLNYIELTKEFYIDF